MHAAPVTRALHDQARPMRPATQLPDRVNLGKRTYRLEPGCALRLAMRQAGELHVTEGRLWITFDRRARDARTGDRGSDYFVAAGEFVGLAAHDGVVLESHDARQPAGFAWLPTAEAPGSAQQALTDLRTAAVLAADALRRLLLPDLSRRTTRS